MAISSISGLNQARYLSLILVDWLGTSFKTIRSFGENVISGKIEISETDED